MRNIGRYHIVHLLPHAGGGVGTVLKKLVENSIKQSGFSHSFILLESLNDNVKTWCRLHRIEYFENAFSSGDRLYELIQLADVVHIHWWNHPLLMECLFRKDLPLARTVLWSHVNGAHVPQKFFNELLSIPDRFVVATPFSLTLQTVKNQSREFKENTLRLIQSNAGPVENFNTRKEDRQVRVGYIGTVDYSKMNSDFIDLWLSIKTDCPPLIVCGGPSEEALRAEVNARGCHERFDIRGHVNNVPDILNELDILFYPLNEMHYGTGEQVLIEAMSAGVVPVVLDNGCESFIVDDKETGFVAKSKKEFVLAVELLCSDDSLLNEIALSAQAAARSRFAIDTTVCQWHEVYSEVLIKPKRSWGGQLLTKGADDAVSASELFLCSYGKSKEAELLMQAMRGYLSRLPQFPSACYADSRGSAFHYLSFFPKDVVLESMCGLLRSTPKRCCPLCNEFKSSVLVELNYALFDDLGFKGRSDLVICDNCRFIYNDLYFAERNLEKYYQSHEVYLTSTAGGTGGISSEDIKRYQLIWDAVKPFVKTKEFSVLDFGCGKGGFLEWVEGVGGVHRVGIESSQACRDSLKNVIPVYSQLSELSQQSFDVIILSHVMEHVVHPNRVLEQLTDFMNESTVVYIEVPDADFYLASPVIWRELYFEHINHFTEFTLSKICQNQKLHCQFVKKKPFSEGVKDSPDCLYAIFSIKTIVLDSLPCSEQQRNKENINYLGSVIEQKLLKAEGRSLAFWGVSQYVQLVLGAEASVLQRTVGLFDSSASKIGRFINTKKVKHFSEVALLNSNVALLLPDKLYADYMESYLQQIGFKGIVIRF